jgi:hypothetical protein
MNSKSYNLLIKEKNFIENNKYSRNNNSNNVFIANKNSAHIIETKDSKIFGNGFKNGLIRLNKKDNENNIREINSNLISKKIGLLNIAIKKSQYSQLNNSKEQSRNKDKRKNKFMFNDNKEMYYTKLLNNSKKNSNSNNNNNTNYYNKHINSSELRNQKSYSQINTKENKDIKNKTLNYRNFSTLNVSKKNDKNDELIQIKEKSNKNNEDFFPSINPPDKNQNNLKNKINTKIVNFNAQNDINNKDKDRDKEICKSKDKYKEISSLSAKEKAYYILAQSTILSLNERIIFSRTTQKIKSLIPINDILQSNQMLIKDKIKELEQQKIKYNKIIEMPFAPSKIAIISLNLILKDDEDDFKNAISNNDDILNKNEKQYYIIYMKLLMILFNEESFFKNLENIDILNIYDKLIEKGYSSFKDYLYELFISKKFKKELFNDKKIDKYIELFEELPDLIKYEGDIKNNRFISFSYFILYEAKNYFIKLKEFIQLINRTNYYIDYLRKKIAKEIN